MSITKVREGFIETLDASKLTGTLPAIDGSALTGLPPSATMDGVTSTAGGTAMTISTSNYVNTPQQPYFYAKEHDWDYNVGNNIFETIPMPNVLEQQGNGYDGSATIGYLSIYTAPVTGKYLFSGNIDVVMPSFGSSQNCELWLFTSNKNYQFHNTVSKTGSQRWTGALSRTVMMDAGDTAEIVSRVTGTNTADKWIWYREWNALLVA